MSNIKLNAVEINNRMYCRVKNVDKLHIRPTPSIKDLFINSARSLFSKSLSASSVCLFFIFLLLVFSLGPIYFNYLVKKIIVNLFTNKL